MKKFLLRTIYFWGYNVAKVYWFIFRPQVRGVKCIVECNGKILLIRNSYGLPGWTFPGGGIQKNESSIEAARRELWEEVGVKGETLSSGGSFITTKEYKVDTVEVYFAEVDKSEITIDNEEVVEARWFESLDAVSLTPSAMDAYKLYSIR